MSDYDNLPKTTHYDLNKPDYLNVADIFALNENFDIIDALFYNIKTIADNHYVDEDAHAEAFSKHNTDLQAHSNIFADVNFYVATTGNDNNNGGDATPFRTIQKAVDSIPKGCTNVTINISAGTYNENVILAICNNKQIKFNGEAGVNMGTLKMYGRCTLYFFNISFTANSAVKNCLELAGAYLHINNCNFNGANVYNSIGLLLYGVAGGISNSTIINCQAGVYSVYGTDIAIDTTTCNNNASDLHASGGCIRTNDSTLSLASAYGGSVINVATGKSLTTGVADSTTDATDSSKKLATTEFLKKANGWGFPSNTYIVPTNGMVAPCNGYLFVQATATQVAYNMPSFVCVSDQTIGMTANSIASQVNNGLQAYIPIPKGHKMDFGWTISTKDGFAKFFYAEGEVE